MLFTSLCLQFHPLRLQEDFELPSLLRFDRKVSRKPRLVARELHLVLKCSEETLLFDNYFLAVFCVFIIILFKEAEKIWFPLFEEGHLGFFLLFTILKLGKHLLLQIHRLIETTVSELVIKSGF